jgi:hypothetical protein
MKDECFVGEKRFATPTGISPTGKSVNDDGRDQFENWISAEPYAMNVERYPDDDTAWPRQYKNYLVQVSWEAWQESRRTSGQQSVESE